MGKIKMPNTYVLVAALIVLCAVATWFVPGGQYVTAEDGSVTYESVDAVPQTWQVFSAVYHGFVKQAGIIVFILVVGGAFWLLNATGAVSAGISRFITAVGRRDAWVLAALCALAVGPAAERAHDIRACWVEQQRSYHQRALSPVGRDLRLSERTVRTAMLCSVALYLAAVLFEMLFGGMLWAAPFPVADSEWYRTVLKIAMGSLISSLRTADGKIWLTGYNAYGQMGDGTKRSTYTWLWNGTTIDGKTEE